MVSGRDAHDDWYGEDDPHDDAGPQWDPGPAPRPLALVARPRLAFEVVTPDGFEAAQAIADRLRAGAPVLVDLRAADRELAGRLSDFCSGLAYAVEGSLQPVGRELLLLAPSHVDISGDVASAVRERGFYNRS
jgi:FtsZ-interacting cell division protein YlmF